LVLAFREIGNGYESIKKFCHLMNMPEPMTKKNYHALKDKLHYAYVKTARESMQEAANKIREKKLDVYDDSLTMKSLPNLAIPAKFGRKRRIQQPTTTGSRNTTVR